MNKYWQILLLIGVCFIKIFKGPQSECRNYFKILTLLYTVAQTVFQESQDRCLQLNQWCASNWLSSASQLRSTQVITGHTLDLTLTTAAPRSHNAQKVYIRCVFLPFHGRKHFVVIQNRWKTMYICLRVAYPIKMSLVMSSTSTNSLSGSPGASKSNNS